MNKKKLERYQRELAAFFNTTEWAEAQDNVFRGDAPAFSVMKFQPLGLLQEQVTPTNLTIRQRLIMALYEIGPLAAIDFEKAARQIEEMVQDGTWIEGYAYWRYVVTGLEFYRAKASDQIKVSFALVIERVETEFRRLIGPEGTIDLPETSGAAVLPGPRRLEEVVDTPRHYVERWFEGKELVGFILVHKHFPTTAEARNFHVWPAFGSFVLWIRGKWIVPPHRYTGWKDRQGTLAREGEVLGLPKGAVSPVWRLDPPKVSLEELATGFRFTWKNGFILKHARELQILPDCVRLVDSYAGVSKVRKEWRIR